MTRPASPRAPVFPSGALPDRSRIRERLVRAWDRLQGGAPSPDRFQGRLLRPRFAAAMRGSQDEARLGDRFWMGALAVQLAHEASLLHDDVVDGARTRRGRPTVAARQGPAAALLEGDQLLARSYRAAERTESPWFVRCFAEAVDRTIEGERAQAGLLPDPLQVWNVRNIARAKAGELFGVAVAAPSLLKGSVDAHRTLELGRDLGALYQRVDDLLDYCPGAGTGKRALMDHRRGLWTWPLAYLEDGAPPERLFHEWDGHVPALEAMAHLEEETRALLAKLHGVAAHVDPIAREVEGWLESLRSTVEGEVARRRIAPQHSGDGPGTASRPQHDGGPNRSFQGPGPDPTRVLAHHGRTFSFASLFLSAGERERAARVYAFCRMVDDVVDRGSDPEAAEASLERILRQARNAYEKGALRDGDPLGRAMVEMREVNAPFQWVEELVEGVGMDLRPDPFQDHQALRGYTRRVAGVVGLWMGKLGGVRDDWALSMAEEMGHAMQLTNIVRDVGADLELGRLYLPLELLEHHGLRRADLERLRRDGGPVPAPFAAVLEDLLGRADAGYRSAFQALPHLRPGFRKAMAVAARVYQGIHREVRRNGYDTLRTRARTRAYTKGVLAVAALRDLRSAERRAVPSPSGRSAATPTPGTAQGSA